MQMTDHPVRLPRQTKALARKMVAQLPGNLTFQSANVIEILALNELQGHNNATLRNKMLAEAIQSASVFIDNLTGVRGSSGVSFLLASIPCRMRQ